MIDFFEVTPATRSIEKQSSTAKAISENIQECVGYHDTVVLIVNDLSAWPLLIRLLAYALKKRALSQYCLKSIPSRRGDGRTVRYRVDLNQPSQGLLLKLDERLSQSHYRLIRVDTAYDFVVAHTRCLKELRAFFEQRAVVTYSKTAPNQYKSTSYLSKLVKGKKPPRENIAIYENKASIFNDAPNVHIERRRHDKLNVATAGIRTLRDLAHYDFDARIGEDLCLYEVTNKSEIGKLLLKAKQCEGKRPEAVRKAGERAFNDAFESEQFMAQMIWVSEKHGREYLKPICMKPLRPVLGFGR